MNIALKGIMPALITPVDRDGSLREDAARELVERLLGQGVHGFYVCGNTGEGPALSEETRRRMLEAVLEQTTGRGTVICHVGAADAQSALRLARHAYEAGCNAISSLPPTGYYDYSEDEIFDYYKALGESTPLPLLVYANGMFKQADIAPFIGRLTTLPTVCGVKFTRMNCYELRNLVELGIAVVNGPDESLVNGLAMGACAGIGSTYNLMPERFVRLYKLFTAGEFEAARQVQFEINRIIRVIIKHGVIRSTKQALCELGFGAGEPAWPGRGFTPEESRAFRAEMESAGFRFSGPPDP